MRKLLHKYSDLLDGNLVAWIEKPIHLDLKENAQPYYAHAFPIPRVYELSLRKEIEHLIKIGVLAVCTESE